MLYYVSHIILGMRTYRFGDVSSLSKNQMWIIARGLWTVVAQHLMEDDKGQKKESVNNNKYSR